MATAIPEVEPDALYIGDTWEWKRTDLDADYPNSAWTLKYVLQSQSPAAKITLTATNSGTAFLISVTPATTAAYSASHRSNGLSGYAWQLIVTKTSSGERRTLLAGTFDVGPDFSVASAGYDFRSHVRKAIDALESTIEGRATADQLSYTIGRQQLSKMTPEQLHMWRDKYRAYYFEEQNREREARGQTSKRLIRTTFL